jgi:hypothetical protein
VGVNAWPPLSLMRIALAGMIELDRVDRYAVMVNQKINALSNAMQPDRP